MFIVVYYLFIRSPISISSILHQLFFLRSTYSIIPFSFILLISDIQHFVSAVTGVKMFISEVWWWWWWCIILAGKYQYLPTVYSFLFKWCSDHFIRIHKKQDSDPISKQIEPYTWKRSQYQNGLIIKMQLLTKSDLIPHFMLYIGQILPLSQAVGAVMMSLEWCLTLKKLSFLACIFL